METTFLKIIQSNDVTPVTTLLSRLDNLLAGGARQDNGQMGAQVGEGASAIVAPVHKKKQPLSPVADQKVNYKQIVEAVRQDEGPASSVAPVAPSGPIETDQSVSEQAVSSADRPMAPSEEVPRPDESPAPRVEPHQRSVRRDWMDFIAYVRERSVWMAQDLQRADSAKEQGSELLLHYVDPANCSMLRKDGSRKLITEFALDFFQKELSVRFVLPDHDSEAAQEGKESPLKERHLLANDPLVQMTAEIFNGQIGDIRVGPRFR
jgi:DNA polymerase-3 subunit gamma/tau